MACSRPIEPPCESILPQTPTGCCSDGRRCDELCAFMAAAEECKQATHGEYSKSFCEGSEGDAQSQGGCSQSVTSTVSDAQATTKSRKACCESNVGALNIANGCCSVREDDNISFETPITVCEAPGSISREDNPLAESGEDDCCASKTRNGASCCSPSIPVISQDGSATSCCTDHPRITIGRNENSEASTAAVESSDVHAESTNEDASRKTQLTVSTVSDSSLDDTENVTEINEIYSSNLQEAIKKYTAYLHAGICICKSALHHVDVCCDQEKRAVFAEKRKLISDACYTDTNALRKRCKLRTSEKTHGAIESPSYQSTINTCKSKSDCCKPSRDPRSSNAVSVAVSCCEDTDKCNIARSELAMAPAKSCETSHKPFSMNDTKSSENATRKKEAVSAVVDDVEFSAAMEHVNFSVTGMTCTGCVKKIMSVMQHIEGVREAKINFVAGVGEMDLNNSKISTPVVLQRLERETGFKCTRILSEYQTLDLFMARANAKSFSDNLPDGVDSIQLVRKTFRVTFDPLRIGARDILAKSEGSLAPPCNDQALVDGRRQLVLKFWSFIAATILTIPVVVFAWSEAPVSFQIKSIVSLVLATFVQMIAIPEFYTPALKALIFSKSIEMDMLVVISITAAYGYSVVAFGLEHAKIELEQGKFFETSTLLITLVILGRLITTYAKSRAVRAVSIKSLQVETAHLEGHTGDITEIDARLLEFSDVIQIPPHSKIVSDGEVIEGESTVDESMLTGESCPVAKTTGDSVVAGTLNCSGPLRVRLTRLPGQNSVTDIANLVQGALNTKPKIQDLADVAAGYFVPIVVSIAVVVFAIWIAVALRGRHQNAGGAIGTAITYSIAVLAISCPCALGLAVPLVLVIAGGVAARAGVIIKHADATERGFRVTDVIFDKTGTLTTGVLQITRRVLHDNELPESEILALAYALVKNNEHPISQAVALALKAHKPRPLELKTIESIPGAGIQAKWKGMPVRAGNPYWLGMSGNSAISDLQAEGLTMLCVVVSGQLVMSFGLKADLRPEAHSVINQLHKRGLECHIVSGDQPAVVSNTANALQIPLSNVASRTSPADKQVYVQRLIALGKTTLFVGDGTNDAVAIAQANVGVQIGSASDVTRATADVVLLGGLEGIITLLEVSRQSYYRIIFNFVWSFVYNLFAILLASGAFVKVRITPSFAGLGEIVSVLPVVLAALSLLQVEFGRQRKTRPNSS